MNLWIVGGIALLVVAGVTVANLLGWIDLSDKTKRGSGGVGSGFLGAAFDEVFHPVRHEAQLELQRQTTLPAPAPEADGDDLGVYGPMSTTGTVSIRLDRHGNPESRKEPGKTE